METPISEAAVEEAAISWFQELGYEYLPGPDIAPGEPTAVLVVNAGLSGLTFVQNLNRGSVGHSVLQFVFVDVVAKPSTVFLSPFTRIRGVPVKANRVA